MAASVFVEKNLCHAAARTVEMEELGAPLSCMAIRL